MDVFTIGPLFTRNHRSEFVCEGMRHAGFDLEFASATCHLRHPVYVNDYVHLGKVRTLSHLQIYQPDLPPWSFRHSHRLIFLEEHRPFYPFDDVLASFITEKQCARPLLALLEDIRSVYKFTPDRFDDVAPAGSLRPEIERAGFRIVHPGRDRQNLSVQLGWIAPQDRAVAKPGLVRAGGMNFAVKPGEPLGLGTWGDPEWGVQGVAHRLFRDVAPENPLETLTEAGRNRLLKSLRWTRLERMTPKQVRAARIRFIRGKKLLDADPREIARALRAAGLYDKHLTPGCIVEKMASVLREARAGKRKSRGRSETTSAHSIQAEKAGKP